MCKTAPFTRIPLQLYGDVGRHVKLTVYQRRITDLDVLQIQELRCCCCFNLQRAPWCCLGFSLTTHSPLAHPHRSPLSEKSYLILDFFPTKSNTIHGWTVNRKFQGLFLVSSLCEHCLRRAECREENTFPTFTISSNHFTDSFCESLGRKMQM